MSIIRIPSSFMWVPMDRVPGMTARTMCTACCCCTATLGITPSPETVPAVFESLDWPRIDGGWRSAGGSYVPLGCRRGLWEGTPGRAVGGEGSQSETFGGCRP